MNTENLIIIIFILYVWVYFGGVFLFPVSLVSLFSFRSFRFPVTGGHEVISTNYCENILQTEPQTL